MRFTKLVQDYPITLTVGVNGILLNFAAAFTQPTFVTFSLLFTGAVLVRGRHTVTRMIVSAGIRASHHARFHRFFSKARWEMDHLWRGLVKLIDRSLIPEGTVVRVGVDDTAQRKTGAKIYGVGMVHDNRPAARKGWDLSRGLTWVVTTTAHLAETCFCPAGLCAVVPQEEGLPEGQMSLSHEIHAGA